ncbi:antichymotrypsin-2-like [Tribolium madens]|uniref:antichymotrypsin-2-like n=1 Tax=Tribolium madens TaxID=41895 RepID=UPI001CF756D1|nr:antichymotrypsin-2-like [Tribolium madens]
MFNQTTSLPHLCTKSGSPINRILISIETISGVGKKSGNFIASPFLVESTFAALYLGSSGKAAEEIRRVFHLPEKTEETEDNFKTLFSLFTNQGYNLHIANKFCFKESFLLNPIWQKQVKSTFQMDASVMNFSNTTAVAEKMNHWIREHTNDKIETITSVEALNVETDSVILGALYFQGEWEQQFSTTDTIKASFYKTTNISVSVDMMQLKEHMFLYGKSDTLDATFLELPFGKSEASMVFILTEKFDGLYDLESKIDQVLQFRDFNYRSLNVLVPKFRIKNELDLIGILSHLGLRNVFSVTNSALSGLIINSTTPSITKVAQKTFLGINERGIEAAAGQKLTLGMMRAMIKSDEFRADHPFMFYLKIKDLVVFVGGVIDL